MPDSDEEMSIGHGSASDMSEASSQDAAAVSHVTEEEELAEASSRAAGPELQQNGHKASLNGDLNRSSDTVLQHPDHQLRHVTAVKDTRDNSEGVQPNGQPATSDQSQQGRSKADPFVGEASSAGSAQEEQGQTSDTGHATASASDSCMKHPAAASFDPEAAKEAELADQQAGAVVEEPDAAAGEPALHMQGNPTDTNDQSAAPPTVADASKLANSGSARSQSTRSSSRQLQAKPTPWR